jgi:hypothetical protein
VKPFKQIQPNVPVLHIADANQIVYYSFVVGDNAGSISAESEGNLNQLIFVFRRAASPSDTRKDGTSGSNAYLAFPQPGTFHFDAMRCDVRVVVWKLQLVV